jgi:hypothetical protein
MPKLLSTARQWALMVACAAMMTACAGSSGKRARPLPRAADPVVERSFETRLECPAELLAPVPDAPPRPRGGAIEADRQTLDWLGQMMRWGRALADRLRDAQGECPAGAARR